MRLALISDIHSNITGLEAVLAYIQKMGGVDALYVLGDLIGGGVAPSEVLDLLIQNKAHLLRGNWEELLFDVETHIGKAGEEEWTRRTIAWTRARLSEAQLGLLRGLPLQETVEVAPQHKIFLCHAAPNDAWSLTCKSDVPITKLREVYGQIDAEIVAYGHFHEHHAIPLDGKQLLNVASVGLREDGLSALTLLEYNRQWVIQQRQVPYDTEAEKTRQAIAWRQTLAERWRQRHKSD